MGQTRTSLIFGTIGLAVSLTAQTSSLNHPTGNKGVLLIDKLGAHLRFLDPITLSERSNLSVQANPHDFALSPDHSIAYVPIYGEGVYGNNPRPGHEIDIVDLNTRTVAGMIDVAPYRAPHGIQTGPSGLLYVTCDLDRKLLVIDPRKRSIVTTIDTEGTGHWIALLPDESKIYVANKNDRPFISVLDLKTRKMIGKIPAPNGTQGITASPDGRRIVAADFAEPLILVIDPTTDTVVDRIPVRDQAHGGYKVYYSPDGRYLLTMNNESRVNIFDADDLHAEQRVLTVGRAPMGFAFSPDGKTVLVANHGDGSISVVDLQGAKVVRGFHAGTGIETLSYY